MEDDLAIVVDGIAKTYVNARVGGMESSLREAFTAAIRAPWRLLPGLRPHDHAEDVVALQPISFTVRRGEKLGIIGRNGSGKSTLLKILARITPPTAGRAEIRGRVASILEVGTGFHPDLTGYENIFLNGAILGMGRRQIREYLPDIIAFAELQDALDLPVKRYSSGMYVRLAFSVAAHLPCDVLLVDEVLAVGDGAFRSKCLEKMQSDVEAGRTVLFVSHDLELIRCFCDRVILLVGGSLHLDGSCAEGLSRYGKYCQRTAVPCVKS